MTPPSFVRVSGEKVQLKWDYTSPVTQNLEPALRTSKFVSSHAPSILRQQHIFGRNCTCVRPRKKSYCPIFPFTIFAINFICCTFVQQILQSVRYDYSLKSDGRMKGRTEICVEVASRLKSLLIRLSKLAQFCRAK